MLKTDWTDSTDWSHTQSRFYIDKEEPFRSSFLAFSIMVHKTDLVYVDQVSMINATIAVSRSALLSRLKCFI